MARSTGPAWATAAAVLMLLGSLPALAQGSPAPQPPAAPTGILADPVFQSAQKRYEALPESERRAIQEALMWTGDFSGAGSGAYGPLTFKAIQAFQKRASAPTDGYLQPKERAALEAAADRARGDVRFTKLQDGKAGLRIGMPQAVLTKTTPTKTGTRYASADGAVVLETFTQDNPDLAGLFDRLKADAPGRKVSYKVLRPDWFVIAADENGKRSYTRFALAGAGLKGFVFTYPIASAASYDRIGIAVANSFEPSTGSPSTPIPSVAVQPAAAPPISPVSSGPLATGLVVASGKVLTSVTVAECAEPAVSGKPAKVAQSDKALGLALLDVPGLNAPGPALGPTPADAASLVLLGFGPAGSGPPQLSVMAGEARLSGDALRVVASLQKGAAGAPVFDRSGALVGLVAAAPQQPRLVAGIVPEQSYPIIPAADLARFAGLSARAGESTATKSAADIAAAERGAVVSITCRQ